MSYHTGWMYFADAYGNPSEIINEYRTRQNMIRAKNAGVAIPFDNLTPVPDGICSTLGFEPCTMDAYTGAVTSWAAINTGPTVAPWYNSNNGDDSTEALGFWIDEWTGLDGAHHLRSTSPRGSRPYGAAFGLQSQKERVMAFNLYAVGVTERGLEYLFRWLESTLLATCSPCDTITMFLRQYCPPGVTATALEDGLVSCSQVGLIAGPTWETPPIEGAACFVRKISFTLAAGDPCLRRVPAAAVSNSATWTPPGSGTNATAGCNLFSGSAARQSVAVTAPMYGMTSPKVTITSSKVSGVNLPALRIVGLLDKDRLGALNPCGQERNGLITLDNIPTGWEVIVDCGTAQVTARDLYGDRVYSDGSSFVQANANYDPSYTGRRAINFLNCVNGYVVVEPAWNGAGYATTPLAWTTSVQMQERFGCSG